MRSIPAIGLLVGLISLASLSGLTADDKPTPTRPIDDLVRDLGSPFFTTRERAVELLRKRGREAVPALEEAAKSPDPEIARRASGLLEGFSWGLFPDTPPEVIKQITRFRDGKIDEQKTTLSEMLALGKSGREAVRTILRRNLPAESRDLLLTHITNRLRQEVPRLVYDGKMAEAAELLAIHHSAPTPEGASDLAAFHVLRGTLPAAITEAEAARATTRNTESSDLVLAHLYRAVGDFAKARKAAEAVDHAHELDAQAERRPLVPMLLEEEGNWAALLESTKHTPANHPDALRLTLVRLAGRQQAFEEDVKQTRESAAAMGTSDEIEDAALTLLLVNRAADATNLLREKRHNPGLLAELLIARLCFREALGLTVPAKPLEQHPDPEEKLQFDLRRARVLMMIGKREEAIQLFTQVADGLKPKAGPDGEREDRWESRRSLLQTEMRVGLRELAGAHATAFIPAEGQFPLEQMVGETAFDILFGHDADLAEAIYRALLRKPDPDITPGRAMVLVRSLLAGTAPKPVIEATVKTLATPVVWKAQPGGESLRWFNEYRGLSHHLAIAAIFRASNQSGTAEQTYRDAVALAVKSEVALGPIESDELIGARAWVFGISDSGRPWREYGEFLLDQGRSAEAAARFTDGWKQHPDQPLLLYLSGKALLLAGEAKEGARRVELAHWVALGNERVRGKFLEELVRRGEAKAAKRECELILRGCWSRDWYFGNVMNQASRAAVMNQDWATAERCFRRSLLVFLQVPGTQFVDSSAYLNGPHDMLACQARALLTAGRVDDAVARARAVLEITPGHTEMLAIMVPELARIGRKREADELFDLSWNAYQTVLKEYPNSPWARNGLAMLGAGCRRELDSALKYAREATAADTRSVAFRETLAEVHFRRGERDKALEIMTALSREAPRSFLYRRQLERYRTADLTSPMLDSEDDD